VVGAKGVRTKPRGPGAEDTNKKFADLDVAVHNVLFVAVRQSLQNLAHEELDLRHRQRSVFERHQPSQVVLQVLEHLPSAKTLSPRSVDVPYGCTHFPSVRCDVSACGVRAAVGMMPEC